MEVELKRIYRWMLALGLAGTAVAAWRAGPMPAMGFALGAIGAYFNFRWLKQLVEALGPDGQAPGRGKALVLGGRWFLFGIAGYVIVKYFGISPLAALMGFLVAVGAVVFEILYELIYAGT